MSAEVCAGLPLLSTIKGLVESGDRVKTIEGVMSTTLGYIFSAYDGTQKFSDLVRSKTMRAVEWVVGSFSSHIFTPAEGTSSVNRTAATINAD